MEFFYGSSNNDSQSSNVSPISGRNLVNRGRFYPSILDPYASSDSSVSPLVRYFHSSSSDSPKHRSSSGSRGSSSSGGGFRGPLGSIENIESPFRTPVKVEEDVVVMDGILVGPKFGGKNKSSPLSSTSDYSGENKSEVCRRWEDSGSCRFGSKCRFVHGKEDIRSTAFANRNQSEVQISSRSHSSGSCSYGPRGRFVHQQVQSGANPTAAAAAAAMATPTTRIVSVKDKEPPSSGSSTTSTSTVAVSGFTDWCPLDDNIEVFLPGSAEKCTSREDVDAHIQSVLCGHTGRKRLPVFIDLAKE